MKEFILIRHGETDANLAKKFAGRTDQSLNRQGKENAKKLCGSIHLKNCSKIISSPLKRCVETARISIPEAVIETSPELMEMNFGIFENLNYEEIHEKYPEELESWNRDRVNYTIPKGENLKTMSERVIETFQRELKLYNGKTIIFTHGGTIGILLSHYLFGSPEYIWRFSIEHCKITRLNFNEDFAYLKSLNE